MGKLERGQWAGFNQPGIGSLGEGHANTIGVVAAVDDTGATLLVPYDDGPELEYHRTEEIVEYPVSEEDAIAHLEILTPEEVREFTQMVLGSH